MSSLDYACDDCWPERDLERAIGLSDSACWLDLFLSWFSRLKHSESGF